MLKEKQLLEVEDVRRVMMGFSKETCNSKCDGT